LLQAQNAQLLAAALAIGLTAIFETVAPASLVEAAFTSSTKRNGEIEHGRRLEQALARLNSNAVAVFVRPQTPQTHSGARGSKYAAWLRHGTKSPSSQIQPSRSPNGTIVYPQCI
jgi:hypothetical protein